MDSLIFQHLQVFSFLYTKAALPDLKSSLVLFKKDKEPLNVAIGSEVSAIFQKVYWQQVNLYLEITSFSNLNYHINFRICLLICIIRPRELASIPAVILQNVTNESCFVWFEMEKYAFWVTSEPLGVYWALRQPKEIYHKVHWMEKFCNKSC